MKVLSLHLLNFRGIQELTVDFKERTTAFVGINGVGKSTILDALAIALSQLIWRINGNSKKARSIALDDIRQGSEFARISVAVQLRGVEVQWAITKNRKGGQYPDALRKSDLDALSEATRKLVDEWDRVESERHESFDLPLAVYYDVNRSALEIPMRVREKRWHDAHEVYQDTLDHGGADFKRFFIWFRNFEDAENERRTEDPEHREPGLQAARTAITVFTGFQNLRVRRKPLLRMTVTKGGNEFSVLQLSAGERDMLALVGDLARRLSVLNPSLANPNEGGGVVLIDEIDLHLHPRWQRDVVGKLEHTFPNCQFILSTHSPQVVGELKATSVMLLKDGALLGHAERALGLSSGEVLEELMEGRARNASVETALDDVRRLIDEDRLDEAHVKLERLRSQVGDIPEVLETQSAIQSLELVEGNEA